MNTRKTKCNGRVYSASIVCIAFTTLFIVNPVLAQGLVKKTILDNGMTVLVENVAGSPVVAFQALVKTGSATEGRYLGSGISHFVEHMMFKGTEKRSVGQIAKEVKALGGSINASTSFDYTVYSIEVPKKSFFAALDILSDMLMNSRFDPVETERERDVIIGEIRLYRDNPERRISQLVFSNVYLRHPYRHPIIGYEPLLKAVTRDELFDYYKSTHIPNNIVFSVAADVTVDDAITDITRAFENFKPRAYLLRNLPEEPVQLSERNFSETYPTELARLALVYQGIELAHRDLFALDVLAMILGHGESSRLYALRKSGLVYSVWASNYTPLEKGLFEISMTLEDGNISDAQKAVFVEIEKIKKNGVTAQELKKAQRQVLARYYQDRQSASDIASDNASNEAYMGDTGFSKVYVDEIKKLTVSDIQRVANQYLIDRHRSVVSLRPQAKAAGPDAGEPKPIASEIQKIVLENGLTVLLKEDHRLPLVSLRLALSGGLRTETDKNSGIANMTADLWVKGTQSKDAKQIAEMLAAHGMGLSGYSGQNSIGLQSDFLSEDLNFALELLGDVVLHPSFPEDEIAKDKTEIKSAIRSRNDNIFSATNLLLKQTLFLTHPYRRDPLGTPESIDALTRDEIVLYFKKLCVPANMVLAVFGDIRPSEVVALVEKEFGRMAAGDMAPEKFNEPPPEAMREKQNSLDKTQAVVMAGFQAPSLYDADRYAFEVLTSIMGSPLSGRMFTKIRDELGQSYTLGGSYTPGIDVGVGTFYVSTSPQAADKVKEILLGQIADLRENPVNDKELEETKAYLKGVFEMSLEGNGELAFTSALDELYGLGFDNYKRYSDLIDRVTKEDIARVAKAYFQKEKAVVIVTRPPEETVLPTLPQMENQNDIPVYNDGPE